MKTIQCITCVAVIASVTAFSPNSLKPAANVDIAKETYDPLNLSGPGVVPKVSVATAAVVALSPLVAFAGETEDPLF